MKKRIAVALVALVMIVGCVVGGTLAWLVDDTDAVVNTFTYGDINIDLNESESSYKDLVDADEQDTRKNTYKMVPGNTIAKDPKAIVKANSENCYLFVKIVKSTNFDTFMTYEIADGWTQLTTDASGNAITDLIYYRTNNVQNSTSDQSFAILKNDVVTVKDEVTKEMFTALDSTDKLPTLTFYAYAVQEANVDSPALAWSYVD